MKPKVVKLLVPVLILGVMSSYHGSADVSNVSGSSQSRGKSSYADSSSLFASTSSGYQEPNSTGSANSAMPGSSSSANSSAPLLPSNQMNILIDAEKGNDNNSGSASKPVKTIEKAQALVRQAVKTSDKDIVVYLRKGVYTLTAPLEFSGALDSPKDGRHVTYKSYNGEEVLISGGVSITGWSVYDKGKRIVKAKAPEGLDTRDLYINGSPAVRAKTPALSESSPIFEPEKPNIAYKYNIRWLSGSSLIFEPEKGGFVCCDGGALAGSANQSDMEVVFNYQWCIHRVGVSSIKAESKGSRFILDAEAFNMMITASTAGPAYPYTVKDIWYIENAYAFLDEPGECYYDKSAQTIYYMLREGETADSISAYAGKLEQLMVSKNNGDIPFQNTSFEGLTFCHTTWLQPNEPHGYISTQAGFYKDRTTTAANRFDFKLWLRPVAAVNMSRTNGIRFYRNKFINLGAVAIDMEEGTKSADITGNLFADCGGGAVTMGGFIPEYDHHPSDQTKITENCSVSNNYIHDVCTNLRSACGVTVGYSRNIAVSNNTVCDLPYTGISYGWGWGSMDHDFEPVSRGGSISGNRVFNVMKHVYDGGGIYTLSRRDGLVIEGNYVYLVDNDFGGIYLDNSSAGYTVHSNVLRNNKRNFLLTCYNTVVEDNYLDDAASVMYIGFKDADKNVLINKATCDGVVYVLTQEEWESIHNTIAMPAYSSEKSNELIEKSGVTAEYRKLFNID